MKSQNHNPASDQQRVTVHQSRGVTLLFMGQQFDTREALARAFPAFAGDDAVRAIRAGCETVMEVERFCWERRNASYRRSVDGAKKSGYGSLNPRKRVERLRTKNVRGGKTSRKPRKSA